MLFNSLEFAIFLPVVFMLYWFGARNNTKLQNIVLLVASYVFYGWWDYRFLFLLVFSTFLDYFTGLKIYESENRQQKKIWLFISVFVNLGFLGFFKYYNFFVDSFATMVGSYGFHPDLWTLNIILPVGISFYTFHGLSYVFDIYNGKFTPTKNFTDYSVFVSFFPLLVAGPIERATHLLPQVQSPRTFDYSKAVDGLRQILWGLFKKIVIADSCADYANEIFNNYQSYNGSALVLGVFFFTVQIYGDFSGYSDIALGTARLFGFDLIRNFAFPYFSRDIAEFWRRWHISLTTWFRDYLYIPLGGSKGGNWIKIRNTFIIFLVSGFWHGANWTFIAWGFLNALYFLPLILTGNNRNNLDIIAQDRALPTPRELAGMITTFSLTMFAWIFFRAESLAHAFSFIGRMFSSSLFKSPKFIPVDTLIWIFIFFAIEWMGRREKYALERFGVNWPKAIRWSFYYALIWSIGFFYGGTEQDFIYFQF